MKNFFENLGIGFLLGIMLFGIIAVMIASYIY